MEGKPEKLVVKVFNWNPYNLHLLDLNAQKAMSSSPEKLVTAQSYNIAKIKLLFVLQRVQYLCFYTMPRFIQVTCYWYHHKGTFYLQKKKKSEVV